jgi:hypothetical protein
VSIFNCVVLNGGYNADMAEDGDIPENIDWPGVTYKYDAGDMTARLERAQGMCKDWHNSQAAQYAVQAEKAKFNATSATTTCVFVNAPIRFA